MDEQAIYQDFADGQLKYWEAVDLLVGENGWAEARRIVDEWCDGLKGERGNDTDNS